MTIRERLNTATDKPTAGPSLSGLLDTFSQYPVVCAPVFLHVIYSNWGFFLARGRTRTQHSTVCRRPCGMGEEASNLTLDQVRKGAIQPGVDCTTVAERNRSATEAVLPRAQAHTAVQAGRPARCQGHVFDFCSSVDTNNSTS